MTTGASVDRSDQRSPREHGKGEKRALGLPGPRAGGQLLQSLQCSLGKAGFLWFWRGRKVDNVFSSTVIYLPYFLPSATSTFTSNK